MGFSSVEVNSDKQSSLLGNEKQEQSYNLRDGVSSNVLFGTADFIYIFNHQLQHR